MKWILFSHAGVYLLHSSSIYEIDKWRFLEYKECLKYNKVNEYQW